MVDFDVVGSLKCRIDFGEQQRYSEDKLVSLACFRIKNSLTGSIYFYNQLLVVSGFIVAEPGELSLVWLTFPETGIRQINVQRVTSLGLELVP
ncbi:MAG: hypothetical protein KDA65_11740 [Planctomycetaceae bacterium]|nr:hypothetical protein [Planctomycetaceae bacterium]